MSASEGVGKKQQGEYVKYSLLVSPELDARAKDALRLRQLHGQTVKLSDLVREALGEYLDRLLATPAVNAKRVTLDLPADVVEGLSVTAELNALTPPMMAQQILRLEMRNYLKRAQDAADQLKQQLEERKASAKNHKRRE